MTLSDTLEYYGIEFNKIKTSIPKLTEAILKLRDEIGGYNRWKNRLVDEEFNGTLDTKAEGKAFNEVANLAVGTLHSNASKAITGTEYDFPGLKSALLDVIKTDTRVITIEPKGKTARIRVHLGQTAGTLEEYANAVQAAREELGVGKTRRNIQTASKMWAEKVYGVDREGKTITAHKGKMKGEDITDRYAGKYTRTIEARVRNFKNPAPWWSLLENGNASGVMGPGTPYPELAPTRFVARTISDLQVLYKREFSRERNRLRRDNDDTINWIIGRIWKLQEFIEELEKLIAELESEEFEKAIELVEEQLEEYGEDRLSRADPEKLRRLALDLAQGMQIGRRRLGNDVRLRTVQIEKLMEEEFRKNRNVR